MKKLFIILALMFGAMASFSSSAMAQTAPSPTPSTVPVDDGSPKPGMDASWTLAQWKAGMSSNEGCWGCKLLIVMTQVITEVGEKGEEQFKTPALQALSAFMSVWVTWQLYLLMSPSGAVGAQQSINEIFQRLVVMMIVMFLLSQGTFSYLMVQWINPTLAGMMGAGGKLLGGGMDLCGYDVGGDPLATQGVNLMCKMHKTMSTGLAFGGYMADSAVFEIGLGGAQFELLQLVGGVILFAAFFMMMLLLPLRLFDAMLRVGAVSFVLPLVVLGYQFKPTRGVVKQAVTSVLAAGLTFMFTALAVSIAIQVLDQILGPVFDVEINETNRDVLGPMGVPDFLICLASAIGISGFIKAAGSMATEFAGFQGSMGSVGKATEGLIGDATKFGAQKAGGATASAGGLIGGGAAQAGKAVWSGAKGAVAARPGAAPDGVGKATSNGAR
ncbi:hypothetical protein [Sphingosinicella sp. BN140058]|uniref:hypothetical protein n=1 Tax=Sphingosinicella sp. BN140058 TaxID=1892855 RepID=UPI001010B6B8|nr:hypothetical protein [Sphingosinicella sp. BN140058]QAY80199.1 hypothetical protein ETR14_26515 [Sphingosinicella sp. BN140058]